MPGLSFICNDKVQNYILNVMATNLLTYSTDRKGKRELLCHNMKEDTEIEPSDLDSKT